MITKPHKTQLRLSEEEHDTVTTVAERRQWTRNDTICRAVRYLGIIDERVAAGQTVWIGTADGPKAELLFP